MKTERVRAPRVVQLRLHLESHGSPALRWLSFLMQSQLPLKNACGYITRLPFQANKEIAYPVHLTRSALLPLYVSLSHASLPSVLWLNEADEVCQSLKQPA